MGWRILLVAALLPICSALFEDQVGKFDWRKQFVGCPTNILFDRQSSRENNLLFSTKEKVLTSISLVDGSLKWRRIQEELGDYDLPILADESNLFSIADAGRVLRVWNKGTGALVWQKVLSDLIPKQPSYMIRHGSSVIVSVDNVVSSFSSSGTEEWKFQSESSQWSTVVVSGDKLIFVSYNGDSLKSADIINGKPTSASTINVQLSNAKCFSSKQSVVCWKDNTVKVVNFSSANRVAQTFNVERIRNVKVISEEHFAVIAETSTVIHSFASQTEVLKVDKTVEAVASVDKYFLVASKEKIEFYQGPGKSLFTLKLANSKVRELYVSSVRKEIELVVVFEDCRVELFVVSADFSQSQSEWSREEGLARLVSIEMVDLPLSESQKMIEDEFAAQEGNILSSFVRRIISQGIQIQKHFIHSINQVLSFSHITSKIGSFSQLIDAVRNSPRSDSYDSNPLERDFFNLRKMLVVVSLDGSVFGIDSEGGKIVWKLWLGDRFSPLNSELGESRVPLFIQRSTALYQLNGQAVVVFQDVNSGIGNLVFFDPITGTVVERKQLQSKIKNVNLLPVVAKNHLQTLAVVEKGNKITLYPEIEKDSASTLDKVYFTEVTPKGLEGSVLSLTTLKIAQTWTIDLNLGKSEKIISVKSKPLHEKVHSQGRVLIDRNVQYKYVNPNLIALAALDDVSQVLSLYMIDSVTGQIVHNAKTAKAALPVHIVHCENWVAYSYWSEKSRRTELGVIELYEGEELTNQEKFDSFVPTKRAPEVNAQSYVYTHGVDAMGVTETEQGLTTKSILLALPFGGIHEVSRKLLDANRPMELTQEMREEMMIPYMPEIRIATEDMVNYNQTVFRVKGIKTAPSGLESTSLMLAYGVDLFFTRLTPSGTFDILKDDFDHLLISLVLIGLMVASIITKRLARNNALKAAWS
ncbi:unnamed protein product [Auanema sp. JU1783]|nr:unnamed protein product [Auanema sp. JU1783]